MLGTAVVVPLLVLSSVSAQSSRKCYSCASANMNPNYMTKQRGPGNRLAPPLVFDNSCNVDVWLIKERAQDDCPGLCFKWQQALNNSGTLSYLTVRGCYQHLYDTRNPTTPREPQHSFCTFGEKPLECLSDASLIENACWCDGDLCNSSSILSFALLFSLLLIISM